MYPMKVWSNDHGRHASWRCQSIVEEKEDASSESRELDNSAILDRPTRARPGSIRKAKQFKELITDDNADDAKFDQSMSYTAEPSQQTETKENETDDQTNPTEDDTQTTKEDETEPVEAKDDEPSQPTTEDDTEQPNEDAPAQEDAKDESQLTAEDDTPPEEEPKEDEPQEAKEEVAAEQTNSESVQTKDDTPSEATEDALNPEEKKEEEDKEVEMLFAKLEESECESLLKKYLSQEIFETLKSTRTDKGCDFKSCIRSGIDNLDSGVGVYASDADAYNVFSALLHPIIVDYHKLDSLDANKHPKQNFAFDAVMRGCVNTHGLCIVCLEF
eukprot:929572_1